MMDDIMDGMEWNARTEVSRNGMKWNARTEVSRNGMKWNEME